MLLSADKRQAIPEQSFLDTLLSSTKFSSEEYKVKEAYLFFNDLPVDLASSNVVVSRQGDIEISFVIAQVKIHFAPVVENIDFAWNRMRKTQKLILSR